MSKIKIITDSICNISNELACKLGIDVVPLRVCIDGVEYYDGKDITNKEFYEKLKTANELPKTSQASMIQFKEIFEKYLNEGYEILYLGGSSVASGTFQSAYMAKNEIESKNIHLFDTMNIAIGAGIQVLRAYRLSLMGYSIEKIIDNLNNLTPKLLFYVETLEYLKKGGRISSTKATIGTALGLKPLITVKEGLPVQTGMVKGSKKTLKTFMEYLNGNYTDGDILIAYGENIEEGNSLKLLIEEKYPNANVVLEEVCSIIATHTGSKGLGISFY